MKHLKLVPLVILSAALVFTGCEFLEDLQTGVAHTASRINSVQALGGSEEFAFVDIEYVFTGTGVSGQQAVFSRENSGKSDTVNIVLAGTFYTDVDTLEPNWDYKYDLSLLSGSKLSAYDEVTVKTLPILSITHPVDTMKGEGLVVRWAKLSYEGEDYLTYEVALYDGEGLDLTDPDLKSLLALTNPVEGPEIVELTASDSEGSYTFSTDAPTSAKGYIIKVSTRKALFDKLSNKSTAFKPFLWTASP